MNRRWRFGSAWRLANVAHKRKHLIESLSDPLVVGSLAASETRSSQNEIPCKLAKVEAARVRGGDPFRQNESSSYARDAGFAPSTAYNASGENQLIRATLAKSGTITDR
jgi:hypothetical protein